MIANWKSNKNRAEVEEWMHTFEKQLEILVALDKLKYDTVICPPMPSLSQVSDRLLNKALHSHTFLGVQDISPFPAGSYTGAVSGHNLIGFGVKYAVVGHSERRKYFKESSLEVSKKVESCIEERITPIVCVDRNEIDAQADFIEKGKYSKLVVAYEPVDHIGTGIAQDVSEVLPVMRELKAVFRGARIIYGGSVNPDNIDEFIAEEEIEGFLVGHASLDVDEFGELLKA